MITQDELLYSDELLLLLNKLQEIDEEEHGELLLYATMRDSRYFLASVGDEPVGYLSLSYLPETNGAISYVIKRAFVRKQWRRHRCHAGLHCLQACLRWIQSQTLAGVTPRALLLPLSPTHGWIASNFHRAVAISVAQTLASPAVALGLPALSPPAPSPSPSTLTPTSHRPQWQTGVPPEALFAASCDEEATQQHLEHIEERLQRAQQRREQEQEQASVALAATHVVYAKKEESREP
jgi:hypothetical protein